MSEQLAPDGVLPATWYRVNRYKNEIEAVVVKKVTAQFVTIREDYWKQDRRTSREGYFETWEAAHKFLLGKLETSVSYAEQNLQRQRSELGKVKSMRKPE